MKNYVNEGKTLNYANGTGADIASGDVVVVGTLLCVAAVDIANGGSGILHTGGVYDLPKVDAAVIGQGETLTWDISVGAFDDDQATPAAGDITGAAAVAVESKGATTDGTIRVRLTGVPGDVESGA